MFLSRLFVPKTSYLHVNNEYDIDLEAGGKTVNNKNKSDVDLTYANKVIGVGLKNTNQAFHQKKIKMNKTMLMALVPLLLSVKYAVAQSSFPQQLVGTWRSAEYIEALASDQGEKLCALISPQILWIDSLGSCTIQSRMEHRMSLGKPISKSKIENSFQFSYAVNKSILVVHQVRFNNDLLYITFSGVPVSTVFKRYK